MPAKGKVPPHLKKYLFQKRGAKRHTVARRAKRRSGGGGRRRRFRHHHMGLVGKVNKTLKQIPRLAGPTMMALGAGLPLIQIVSSLKDGGWNDPNKSNDIYYTIKSDAIPAAALIGGGFVVSKLVSSLR